MPPRRTERAQYASPPHAHRFELLKLLPLAQYLISQLSGTFSYDLAIRQRPQGGRRVWPHAIYSKVEEATEMAFCRAWSARRRLVPRGTLCWAAMIGLGGKRAPPPPLAAEGRLTLNT